LPNFRDRALLSRRVADVPRCFYPHEDLLAYNPARDASFPSLAASDEVAAVQCVLMCASVVERMEGGKERRGCHGGGGSGWEENEKKEQEEDDEDEDDRLAHYVSNTCAILSQKLDRDGTADVVVTLHCIATLAWVGVRSASFCFFCFCFPFFFP
jgi:hypothetical protein